MMQWMEEKTMVPPFNLADFGNFGISGNHGSFHPLKYLYP